MKYITIMVLVFCSISDVMAAQDERILQAEAEVALEKKTDTLNQVCGTSLKTIIDWSSFSTAKWQKYSIAGFCGTPVESLTYLCGGNNSKAYIKNKIKEIKCSFGGEGKRNLTIEQGAVHYVVDFDAYNADEYTHAALVEKL